MIFKKRLLTAILLSLSISLPCEHSYAYDDIASKAYETAQAAINKENGLSIDEAVRLLEYSASEGNFIAAKTLLDIQTDKGSSAYSISKARKNLLSFGMSGNYRGIDFAYNKFSDKNSVYYSDRYKKVIVEYAASKGFSRYAIMLLRQEMKEPDSSSTDVILKYYPLLVKEQEKNPGSRSLALLRFDILNLGFVPSDIDKFSVIEPLANKGDKLAISYMISNMVRTESLDFSTCGKLLGYIDYQRRYNKVENFNIVWRMAYSQCAEYKSRQLDQMITRHANEIHTHSKSYRKSSLSLRKASN
ncbi:hypothetical protein [Vibrio harveyi]